MKAVLITLLKVYEAFLMGRLCWIYVVSPGTKAVKYIHALSCRLSQFVSTEKVSCMFPESRCKVSCTSFNWCPLPYMPTESKVNTGVGLLPLLLPVISSLPHPARKPIIHAMIMKPRSMYPKFLGGLTGFIPKIFLMIVVGLIYSTFICTLIFFLPLQGDITRLIDGFMPGFFSTLFSPIGYSSTDLGVTASLWVNGKSSINTWKNFRSQDTDSVCSSMTRCSIGVTLTFIAGFFFCMTKYLMRAPQLMKLNVYQRYASKASGLSISILSLCEIRYTFITKLTDLFSFVKCDELDRLKTA